MSVSANRPSGAILEAVDRFIQQHELLAAGERVLVGLSGGVDSVVLVHVLRRLGYDPVAAHVNYGLRGGEADADEAFVREWCNQFDPPVPLDVAVLDAEAHAEAHDQSVQAAARTLRYRYFAERAKAHQITRVAVAHHRDDQAETLLLNLFRGSGLAGLAGMPPTRPLADDVARTLVRPMLAVRRAAIEAYAETNDVPWRTDASNWSRSYRRSRVRHDLLPAIEDAFEGATENIAAAATRIRDYLSTTQDPELIRRFDRVAGPAEGGGTLSVERLAEMSSVWRQRIILEALRRWGPEAPQRASVAAAVEELLEAQVGRRVELGGALIWRERHQLRVVAGASAPDRVSPQRLSWGEPVDLPGGTLRVERLPEAPYHLDSGTPAVAFVDANTLTDPLLVRSWQPGDRFQPLGMEGTKRISDFLTDEQVPPHARAQVLVLCSGDRIVWVVGHRLDHRMRVRPETTTVARLAYIQSERS